MLENLYRKRVLCGILSIAMIFSNISWTPFTAYAADNRQMQIMAENEEEINENIEQEESDDGSDEDPIDVEDGDDQSLDNPDQSENPVDDEQAIADDEVIEEEEEAVFEDESVLFDDEEIAAEDADPAEKTYTVKVNEFENSATITYNTPLEVRLLDIAKGNHYEVFYIKKSEADPSITKINNGTMTVPEEAAFQALLGSNKLTDYEVTTSNIHFNPDVYYLAYNTQDEGWNYTAFTLTIKAAEINAPSNLQMTSTEDDATITAKWTAPNTDKSGKSLIKDDSDSSAVREMDSSVLSYKLNLYKDGKLVYSIPNATETDPLSGDATGEMSYDATTAVKKYGYGKYTFSVSALLKSSTDTRYKESAVATCTTENGYEYVDKVAPEISNYMVTSAKDGFSATVKDNVAVKYYAFTNSATAPEKESPLWKSVTSSVKSGDVLTGKNFTDAGKYYLHIADARYNTASTTSALSMSKLTLHKNNGQSDEVKVLYGTGNTVDLPSNLTLTGHDFEGWYPTENPTIDVNRITKVVTDDSISQYKVTGSTLSIPGGDVSDVYVLWNSVNLALQMSANKLTAVYAGQAGAGITFTAQLKNTKYDSKAIDYDTAEYKWYRKVDDGEDELVSGFVYDAGNRLKSTLTIKNVVDSGTYYAKITIQSGASDPITFTSPSVVVTITPADLKVTVADKTIIYGDPVPTDFALYDAKTVGLFAGDNAMDEIKKFHTNYTQGHSAGKYAIEVLETKENSNYNVIPTAGTLTVNRKTTDLKGYFLVNGDVEENFSAIYTGSAIEPAVVAYNGVNAIDNPENIQYTVRYENNVNATTDAKKAAAIIDFGTEHGNYSGTIRLPFTITKYGNLNVEVHMKDSSDNEKTSGNASWIYGNDEDALTAYTNSLPTTSAPVFYYASQENDVLNRETASKTRPINAGTYNVWAYVAADANYEEATSAPFKFEIKPREITLTAGSTTFPYDGKIHIYEHYDQEGTFKEPDGFQSVQFTGSISTVGEADNTITYKLTPTTNPDNYIIKTIPGKLTMTGVKLTSPSGFKWDDSRPGTIKWIPIAQNNLTVEYDLTLYRNSVADDNKIKTVTVTGSEYNFETDMLSDSETNSAPAGYKVQIISKPVAVDGQTYENYQNSDPAVSESIFTAKVTLNVSEAMIDRASFNSVDGNTSTVYLLEGRSANAYARTKIGYEEPLWEVQEITNRDLLTLEKTSGESNKMTFTSANGQARYVNIKVYAKDEPAIIQGFTAVNDAENEYDRVKLTIKVKDEKGLTGYKIVKATSRENAASQVNKDSEFTSFTADPVSDVYTATQDFTGDGKYYLAVMDSAQNITVSTDEQTINVYKIIFNSGKTEEEEESLYTGTMNDVYKVANSSITLPANAYTKVGATFKNWVGTSSSSIISDGATYTANVSDVLKAQWDSATFEYTVKYYYANPDGSYDGVTPESKTYSGTYHTTITSSTDAIQQGRTGFKLDESPDKQTSVVLGDVADPVVSIYYARKQYKIIYSYTKPDGEEVEEFDLFNYGSDFGESIRAIPEEEGYSFIGWQFQSFDITKNTIMPARNLKATGVFSAESVTYYVNYYLQDLPTASSSFSEDSYSETPASTYTLETTTDIIAEQGSVKTISLSTADKDFDGFTITAASVSKGAAGGTTAPTSNTDTTVIDAEKSIIGKVDTTASNTLHINYYFTRNKYDVTLNVWKDKRDVDGNKLFTRTWKVSYGVAFTSDNTDAMSSYGYTSDPETNKWYDGWRTDGSLDEIYKIYKLANYTGWSTGTTAPTSMPAGPITVTKEYVKESTARYKVEFYFQKADLTYDATTTSVATYYDIVGKTVTLQKEKGTNTEDTTYLSYDEIGKTLNKSFTAYVYDADLNDKSEAEGGKGKLSGTVIDNEVGTMTLKIYFKRTKVPVKVTYQYKHDGSTETMVTYYKWQPWGSTMVITPTEYFYGQSSVLPGMNATTEDVSEYEEGKDYTNLWYNPNHLGKDYNEEYCEIGYTWYRIYDGVAGSSSVVYSSQDQIWDSSKNQPKTLSYTMGYGYDVKKNYITITYSKFKTDSTEDRSYYMNVTWGDSDNFITETLVPTGENTYGQLTKTNVFDEYGVLSTPEYNKYTSSGGKEDSSATEFNSGTKYKIRIMNEKNLYEDSESTSGDSTSNPKYKVVNLLNDAKTVTHTRLKNQYKEVKITTEYNYKTSPSTYYLDEENKIIIIPDKSNTLVAGKNVSFSLYTYYTYLPNATNNPGGIGVSDAWTRITDYRKRLYHNPTYYNPYTTGKDMWNSPLRCRFGTTDKPTQTRTLSYDGRDISRTYTYGYLYENPYNDTEALASYKADDGYKIVWYEDTTFTKPVVEDAKYPMTEQRKFYGHREKTVITNYDYITYELPKKLKDSVGVSYVTESNYSSLGFPDIENASTTMTGSGKEVVKDAETVTRSYYDNNNPNDIGDKEYEANRYRCYIDGELVLIIIENKSLSFSTITLSYDDYNIDGFEYSSKDSNNKVKGYCQTNGTFLQAFFHRNEYTVDIYTPNKTLEGIYDVESRTEALGAVVTINPAEKDGYDFTGWEIKNKETNTSVDPSSLAYSLDAETKKASFVMPAENIVFTPTFEAAGFDFEVKYIFQKGDGSYDASVITNARAVSSSDVTVVYGGNSKSGKLYKNGSSNVAASFEETVDGRTVTYYFVNPQVDGSNVKVKVSNLAAATQTFNMISDEEKKVSDYLLDVTQFSIFSFAYTNCVASKTNKNYTNLNDTFKTVGNMSLSYYFNRSASYVVRTLALASDATDTIKTSSGLSVSGAGEYSHGEEATLTAVIQKGYTFIGWYAAEDVLPGYESAGAVADLSTFTYVDPEKLAAATPIPSEASNANQIYKATVEIEKVSDYVAISAPTDFTNITVDLDYISGNDNYIYGYTKSTSNYLQAKVTFDKASKSKATVTGYQWYKVSSPEEEPSAENIIEGATGATYLVPTGLEAGDHYYKYVISMRLTENGRTGGKVAENAYTLTVGKYGSGTKKYHTAADYNAIYDGESHSISVAINTTGIKPASGKYEVYYSLYPMSTWEIVEGSLGTTVFHNADNSVPDDVKFKDVEYSEEDGSIEKHTVYYYIRSLDSNFADVDGSQNVTIRPITVTLEMANAFGMKYNGTTNVTGEDLERLINGEGSKKYFTIKNSEVLQKEAGSWKIALKATFNSSHVDEAQTVLLSEIKITDNEGNQNLNYNVGTSASYTCTLTGYIEALQLHLEWPEEKSFVYDSTSKVIIPTLKGDLDVPDADVTVTASGAQTNVGDYTATAILDTAGKTYHANDYTFDLEKETYSITPCPIKIAPKSTVEPYVCNTYIQTSYEVTVNGNTYPVNEDGTSEGIFGGAFIDMTKIQTQLSGKDVGTHTGGVKEGSVEIYQGKTKISYNYDISYPADATLTITPVVVTLQGAVGKNKKYDGNKTANLETIKQTYDGTEYTVLAKGTSGNLSVLAPTGVLGEDVVAFDYSAFSNITFDTPNTNPSRPITFDIDPATCLVGPDAHNYVFDTDLTNSDLTSVAAIEQNVITVTVKSETIVYGDTPKYEFEYSGFMPGDTAENIGITGAPIFELVKDSTTKEASSFVNEGVTKIPYVDGGYKLNLKVDDGIVQGLSSADYCFVPNTEEQAILTVTKRPVTISGINRDPVISKNYDGNTTVKTTLTKDTDYSFDTASGTGETAKGVLAGDNVTVTFASAYNSKNVAEATTINATNVALTTAGESKNYALTGNTFSVNGEIKPIEVKITADNKTITYGDAAPTYTARATGYITADATKYADPLANGLITLTCDYDTSVPEKRGADVYPITISNLTDGNYTLNAETVGQLTVNKKEVTVTTENKTIIYGKEIVPNDDDESGETNYSRTFTGWVDAYSDTKDSVLGDKAGDATSILTKTSGDTKNDGTHDYTQYPYNKDGYVVKTGYVAGKEIVTDNYSFKYVDGKLFVNRQYLSISGIKTTEKTYDGDATVAPEQLDYSDVKFTCYVNTASGKDYTVTDLLPAGQALTDNISVTAAYADSTCKDGDGLADQSVAAKDAGSEKTVTLDISLVENSYLANRYDLLTTESALADLGIEGAVVTQTETQDGVIKKRDASINLYYNKETGAAYSYGKDPLLANKYSIKATGFISPDGTYTAATGLITGLKGNLVCGMFDESDQPYTKTGNVGKYHVAQTDASTLSDVGTNYNLTITGSEVKVTACGATGSAVKLDAANPGSITWTKAVKIGNVEPDHYILEVYKNGTKITSLTQNNVEIAVTRWDWADAIRTEGPGKYTFRVYTVPKTENNTDPVNVTTSSSNTDKTPLYVANVSVYFKTDDVTKGAITGEGSVVSINSVEPDADTKKSTYTVISGETVPITGKWSNDKGNTGYSTEMTTVKSPTGSTVVLTEDAKKPGNGSYSADAKVTLAGYNPDVELELALKKRPATLDAHIQAIKNATISYDYGPGQEPHFKAVVGTASTDNLTITGEDPSAWPYTYTYAWKYYNKKGEVCDLIGITEGENDYTATSREIKLTSEEDDKLSPSIYTLICTITATRKDNDETTSQDIYLNRGLTIRRAVIEPGDVQAYVADWTYGEKRPDRDLHSIKLGVVPKGIGEKTYYYRLKGETTWTEWNETTYPKDVNTYELYATIAESTNYDAFDTESLPYEFKIKQNKLGKWAKDPEVALTNADLKNEPGEMAPYGLLHFKEVFAPKENADSTTDFIAPTYIVKLYRQESKGGEKELIGTYSNDDITISDGICTIDVTDKMNRKGVYTYTVEMKSSNLLNCADSDLYETENSTDVGAIISVYDSESNELLPRDDDGNIHYLYDGKQVTLKVSQTESATYQWYANGVEVTGATGTSHTIQHVGDTAYYSCRVSYGAEQFDSNVVNVTIDPRKIKFVTNSAEKPYDGSALTCDNWKIIEADGTEGAAFVTSSASVTETTTGNTVSGVSVTGTMTNVELVEGVPTVSDNTIDLSGLTIKEPDDTVVHSAAMEEAGISNYDIETTLGTLKISKSPLKITSKTTSKVYDGTPLTSHEFTIGNEDGTDKLNPGDSVSMNFIGTVTDVQYDAEGQITTVDNEYDTIVVTNSAGEDVTNSYDITPVFGTLKIEPQNAEALTAVLDDAIEGSDGKYDCYKWTGDQIEPQEKVTYAGMTLVSGTDYDRSGDLSKKIVKDDYVMTLTLKGNYTGTINLPWKIIDWKAPKATISISIWDRVFENLLEKISFGLFHNDAVTVKLEGQEEDGGSGMSALSYYVEKHVDSHGMNKTDEYDTLTVEELEEKTWIVPEDVSIDGELATGSFVIPSATLDLSVVYVKAVDKAGNITYVSSDGLVIDTVPAEMSGVVADTTYCYDQTIRVSDRYLKNVKINGTEVEVVEGKVVVHADYNTPQTITATDEAGNVTEIASVIVNGHHTFVYEGNNTAILHTSCDVNTCDLYHADNMSVQVSALNGTYNKNPQLATKIVSTPFDGEEELNGTVGDIQYFKTENEGDIEGGTKVDEPVNAGYYYALIPVEGKWNNENYRVVIPYTIAPRDASDPEVTAVLKDAKKNAAHEDYYDWKTDGVTPEVEVKYAGTVLVEGRDYELLNDVQAKKVDNSYVLTVHFMNNYTGTKNLPWQIVDVTNPEASIRMPSVWATAFKTLLSTLTFGYVNNDVAVNLEGKEEDGGSGIKSLTYYVDEKANEADVTLLNSAALDALDASKWTEPDPLNVSANLETATGSFTISKADLKTAVVYLKVVDNVDHVTYVCSDGVVIDTVPVEITGVAKNTTYCHEKVIHVADNHDIAEVRIDGQPVVPDSDGNITVSEEVNTPQTITAKDKAGNVTEIANVTINGKHTFLYYGNNTAVVSTDCALDTCDLYQADTMSVIVSALDGVYTSHAYPATKKVTPSFDGEEELHGTDGDIEYYKTEIEDAIVGGVRVTDPETGLGAEPVNAGYYYALVPIAGTDGNTYRAVVSYTIEPRDKSFVTAKLTNAETGTDGDYKWTGSNLVPTVEVKYGDIALIEGIDYDLSGNTSEKKVDDSYELVVTLKGNYTGTITLPWKILDVEDPEASAKYSVWEETFETILSALTFGIYTNDDVEVTLKGKEEDGGSGIASLTYYVDDTKTEESEYHALTKAELDALAAANWIVPANLTISDNTENAEGSFTISKEALKLAVVYVRVKDKAGHVTYAGTDGIVIDGTPVVITGAENDKEYCKPQIIQIKDRYLKTVTLDGEEVNLADLVDGKLTLVPSETAHTVVATDKGGNVTTLSNVKINGKHTFVYNGDGTETVSTYCALDNCDLRAMYDLDDMSVTVSALNGVYSATPHAATKIVSTPYDGEEQLEGTVGEIEYYKTATEGATTGGTRVTDSETGVATVPVAAGYYYALVPITGKDGNNYRAVIAYTIESNPLTSVTVAEGTLIYDGNVLNPGEIKVFADVDGAPTLLTKDVDYVLTEDAQNKKQTTAKKPGTYTVEAVGIGNFTGTVDCTYTIVDDVYPVIVTSLNGQEAQETELVNGKIVCEPTDITVRDCNLSSVEILTKNGGTYGEAAAGSYSLKSGTLDDEEMVYHLAGSEDGTTYQITVVDASGNTTTVSDVTIYKKHLFTNYVIQPDHKSKIADCDHNCGATDTAIISWGTVHWTYYYNYDVYSAQGEEPEHFEGIQGTAARNYYAQVELQRKHIGDSNYETIATKILNCADECNTDDDYEADRAYAFDSFDPSDPTKEAGDSLIPELDENGEKYNYRVLVIPGDISEDGTKVNEVREYVANYLEEDYSAYPNKGYVTQIEYKPNCFYVPWKVTLSDTEPVPEYLYVKVLYAYGPDADDSETETGYQTLTQQEGQFNEKAVRCDVVSDLNGTVSYEGKYSVWKYQAGTENSYYHRIQITGAGVKNGDGTVKEYDLTGKNLKSINDADHVNHTVGFDTEKGVATGTIHYNPDDLNLPVIWFNENNGTIDTTNPATIDTPYILLEKDGDPVTGDTLGAVHATRDYYEFVGWYDAPEGGNLITEISSLVGSKTLYAHWRELIKPTGEITLGTNKFAEFMNSITMGLFFKKTVTAKVTAQDVNEYGVENSGIDKIYYYVQKGQPLTLAQAEAIADNKWKQMPANGAAIESKEGVILYVRIDDKAGNKTYLSTDIFETHGDAVQNFTTDVNIYDNLPIDSEDLLVPVAKDILDIPENGLSQSTVSAAKDPDNRVQVYLDLHEANSSEIAANGDKAAIEKIENELARTNAKELKIMDVSMWLKINNDEPIRLYSAGSGPSDNKTIEMKYKLGSMPEIKDGWDREYFVAKIHHPKNGGAVETTYEKMEYNKDAKTIAFHADKFSTYAIFYHDYVASEGAELAYVGANVVLKTNSFVYTGKDISPNVNVTYTYQEYDATGTRSGKQSKVKLIQNVDYVVTYENNRNASKPDDKARIIITGIGDYYMDITKEFTIYKKSADKWKMGFLPNQKCTGADLTETIKNSVTIWDGALEVSPDDYNVIITGDTKKAGNVTVNVEPTDNGNYVGKPVKATATIRIVNEGTDLDISTATVELKNPTAVLEYKGIPQKPPVIVKIDNKVIKGANYKVVYENNVNAGDDAIVRVVGINQAYGEAQIRFTITPKDIRTLKVKGLSAVGWRSDLSNIKPILSFGGRTLQAGKDYELRVDDDLNSSSLISQLPNKKRPFVTVSIHPCEGNKNFTDLSADQSGLKLNITVKPRSLGSGLTTKVVGLSVDKGGSVEPGVKVYYNHELLKEGTHYTVTYKKKNGKDNGIVNVTAVVEGKGIYGGKRSVKWVLVQK